MRLFSDTLFHARLALAVMLRKRFIRRTSMRITSRVLSRLSLAFCVVVAWLCISVSRHLAHADHPSYPNTTIELGPGNKDAEEQLDKHLRENIAHDKKREEFQSGPNLSGRDFRRAEIHMGFVFVPFYRVNFDRADFTGANIEESSFSHCSFRSASLRNLYSRGEIADDCDLTDADITGSRIYIIREQLRSTKNYKEKNLSGTILLGDFSGMSFAGFNLRGTVFESCDLAGCNFTDADIAYAGIKFHAETERPNAMRATFTKEQLYSTKSYKARNLDQVIFRNCDFHGANFSGQSLGHFIFCDLSEANFTNADFPLSIATQYPHVANEFQRYAMYVGSCYGFTDCKLTAAQFYSTRTYKSAKLPFNFALERMNLDGWNFSGMDLTCVSFRDSSLKGANFTDARNGDFKFAKNLNPEQIKSTWNYKNDKMKESVGDRPAFRLPEQLADVLQKEQASEKKGVKE
jgi:uncharacterized protein YjbI with pentapeptide repeats